MSNTAPADVKQAIREQSDLFERNFAAGDAAALIRDYYVPEALEPVVSAGDGPALIGHKAITGLFEGFMGAFEKARQVPRFIRAHGNLAYEISNSYLTPKGGGDEVEYRYVATWRKCDDNWRVDSDFFAPGPLV